MDEISHLDFLTLIVGLAVYIGSIRFVIIGRLISEPPPSVARAASYKRFLKLLIPVDASLLAAGAALFLHMFWSDLFHSEAPACLLPIVTWSSAVALVGLIGHHGYSWVRSFVA